MKKVYLFLENGMSFCGQAFGAQGDAIGELVFTTSMVGYLETLTDNNYYGQVVMQTFPLIGNYGVISEDLKGKKPALKAYIVKEVCDAPSNFRCEGDLDTYLKENGVVGICGVDTREITKILRTHGVMNCMITDRDTLTEDEMDELRSYKVKGVVEALSTSSVVDVVNPENPKRRIVLWDFGESGNLVEKLAEKGCEVICMNYAHTAKEIWQVSPDGVVLSDGAGNPADNADIISEIRLLCKKKVPIFGLGLGHQMLAISQGATTHKLKYGHRGSSQPVIENATGRIFITTQNHGYAVTTPPHNATQTYTNVNDKTCEGIEYNGMPVYSLEFAPWSASGPVDTNYMFDKFIETVDNYKK